MKKNLLLAVAAVLALAANAYDFMVGGLCYNINEDGTSVTVTYQNEEPPRYSNLNGLVSIPSKVTYNGATYTVNNIGNDAFNGCSAITEVVMPNTIGVHMSNRAFMNCSGLTQINLSTSLTGIGNNSFDGCSSLKSIEIPEKVTWIGGSAFKHCTNLEKVVLPNGLTHIWECVFESCERLSEINLPSTLQYIGWDGFLLCTSLKNIKLPNSLKTIDNSAFCLTGLEEVELPSSLEIIEEGVFGGCVNLTYVKIPNTIREIKGNAFGECTSLTNIDIPNSVTSIGEKAFSGCGELNYVELPNNKISIANDAFDSHTKVTIKATTSKNANNTSSRNSRNNTNNKNTVAKNKTNNNDGSDMVRARRLMAGTKYLDKSFTLSKDVQVIILDGQSYNLGKETVPATLEVIPFGASGNTIILDIEVPGAKEQGVSTAYSWSGKHVHLAPVVEQGSDVYMIMRGQTTCGYMSRVKMDDGTYLWGARVNATNATRTVSDIQKGMTISEMEDKCAELGLSKFKQLRQSGGMKVYGLYWVDLQKQYNMWGTDYRYQMRNDKLYGEFYFDAKGKLVKWFIY